MAERTVSVHVSIKTAVEQAGVQAALTQLEHVRQAFSKPLVLASNFADVEKLTKVLERQSNALIEIETIERRIAEFRGHEDTTRGAKAYTDQLREQAAVLKEIKQLGGRYSPQVAGMAEARQVRRAESPVVKAIREMGGISEERAKQEWGHGETAGLKESFGKRHPFRAEGGKEIVDVANELVARNLMQVAKTGDKGAALFDLLSREASPGKRHRSLEDEQDSWLRRKAETPHQQSTPSGSFAFGANAASGSDIVTPSQASTGVGKANDVLRQISNMRKEVKAEEAARGDEFSKAIQGLPTHDAPVKPFELGGGTFKTGYVGPTSEELRAGDKLRAERAAAMAARGGMADFSSLSASSRAALAAAGFMGALGGGVGGNPFQYQPGSIGPFQQHGGGNPFQYRYGAMGPVPPPTGPVAMGPTPPSRPPGNPFQYQPGGMGPFLPPHVGQVQKLSENFTKLGETMEALGRKTTTAFLAADAAILGMVRAASPDAFNTFTGSVGLLAGEIGRVFIPQIVNVSSVLQQARGIFRGLSDETKQGIAAWTGYGVAALGAGMVIGRLAPLAKLAGSGLGFIHNHPVIASLGFLAYQSGLAETGLRAIMDVAPTVGHSLRDLSSSQVNTAFTIGAVGAGVAGLIPLFTRMRAASVAANFGNIMAGATGAAGAFGVMGTAVRGAGSAMLAFVATPMGAFLTATGVALAFLTDGFGLFGSRVSNAGRNVMTSAQILQSAGQLQGGAAGGVNVQAEHARLGRLEDVIGAGRMERMRGMTPEVRAAFIHEQLEFARSQAATGPAATARRGRVLQEFGGNLIRPSFFTPGQEDIWMPQVLPGLRRAGVTLPANDAAAAGILRQIRDQVLRNMPAEHLARPGVLQSGEAAAQAFHTSFVEAVTGYSSAIRGQGAIQGFMNILQNGFPNIFGRPAGPGAARTPAQAFADSHPGGIQALMSMNMQARQVPIEGIHDLIQNESIKGPLEQERFNQQMEALRDLVRAANQSNINLAEIIQSIPLLGGLLGAAH